MDEFRPKVVGFEYHHSIDGNGWPDAVVLEADDGNECEQRRYFQDGGVDVEALQRLTEGLNLESSKTEAYIGGGSEKTYVVMAVGGAPIFVVEDFEKAASVCNALTAGAKASGLTAKYDVVEVKRWTI